jgi:hypothetical protein
VSKNRARNRLSTRLQQRPGSALQSCACCHHIVDQQEMPILGSGRSHEAVVRQVESLSPGSAGLPPQPSPSQQGSHRPVKSPSDFVREPFRGNPRAPDSADWMRGYKTDNIDR